MSGERQTYDLVLVGTSFAASFFLHEYLRRSPASRRVLVLERGAKLSHGELVRQRFAIRREGDRTFTRADVKPWWYAPTFGGTSNIWYGNTPRMLEEDFELATRYGRGFDWPLGYGDLEPFYVQAERLMAISGPDDSPCPRSAPYPLPPHAQSAPERELKRLHPSEFFVCPTARARGPAPGRPGCCASYVCNFCPIDAKFTVQNAFTELYQDERVQLELGAAAQRVETEGGVASAVQYLKEGREHSARCELVALGANALFNPHILLRSGFEDAALGRYLHEQAGLSAHVDFADLDNFQGSTSCTGHHYRFARGELRARRAAMLLETFSKPTLRLESGKFRKRMSVTAIIEELPNASSRVTIDPNAPDKPRTHFAGYSTYAAAALMEVRRNIEEIFGDLRVEGVHVREQPRASEGHILGTARMGSDPAQSVVDRRLVHHRVRNLLVLGGSAFPTGAPANPSLTIAALSLWAADGLSSGAR